jgi:hypothetical protein
MSVTASVKIPRVCLVCDHFRLSLGEPGYSEWTPGSPGSMDCDVSGKSAWPRYGMNDFDGPLPLRTIAERCELFEIHEALRGTGSGAAR